jgi:hypothetical protein
MPIPLFSNILIDLILNLNTCYNLRQPAATLVSNTRQLQFLRIIQPIRKSSRLSSSELLLLRKFHNFAIPLAVKGHHFFDAFFEWSTLASQKKYEFKKFRNKENV